MPAKTRNLLQTIAQMLGKEFTLTDPQFKLLIQGTRDGGLFHQLMGNGGATQGEAMISVPDLVVPATDGTLDADITSGTATLVASTVDVTVPGGVPVGSTVYATVTTPAGNTKSLVAVRKSATEITISSPATGATAFKNLAATDGVATAALSGGTIDRALANVAGDHLVVVRLASAGTPGVLSVKRKSDTEVTVESWLAGSGLQVLDTSTCTVYNLGQLAHETSLVRWVVVRP